MSFQAYLDNVQAKTGKTPDDFRALARDRGFLTDQGIPATIKATQVNDWLKTEFDLGHGHAMAIYAMLNGKSA